MSAFNKYGRRGHKAHAQRVDANQDQIVSVLEAVGASVVVIGQPLDLLVGFRGMTFLLEVKNPNSEYGKKGANKKQAEFKKLWRGHPPETVSTPLEALCAIRAAVVPSAGMAKSQAVGSAEANKGQATGPLTVADK